VDDVSACHRRAIRIPTSSFEQGWCDNSTSIRHPPQGGLFWGSLYRSLIGAADEENGRHWNRKVPFVQHLLGAIRSIADSWSWRRQPKGKATYLVSELSLYDAEGQERSLLDNLPSLFAPVDQRLMEKEEGDRILAMFEDDPEAVVVLTGWMNGLKKERDHVEGRSCQTDICSRSKRIQRKPAAQED
jgi:hypothetical protein